MSYLEDVLKQTERVKARRQASGNVAKVGTANLMAQIQAKAVLKQMAAAQATPTPGPRPNPSPVAPTGGHQHSMNDGHGHTSQAEVKGLNKEFEANLNRLIKDSGGRIRVTSGYRSPERQAQLWAAALKKYGSAAKARKWVAPPGKSNHGRGLAADIAGDKPWAHANAHRYGLHFPLANEDWHIEPVGARKKR